MKQILLMSICTSIAMTVSRAVAQEEDASDAESSDTATVEETTNVNLVPAPKVEAEKFFFILPKCKVLEGLAEVCKPNASWESLEEGKFYPLGSEFRTTSASTHLTIQIGERCFVNITGEASFGTGIEPLGAKERMIILKSGKIELKLPTNLPEGLLTITAAGFTVRNPAGESQYVYKPTGDGDFASVRCVTGSLAVEGRHFKIPLMRAANEVHIRTSQDNLVTCLYGKSGDYIVELEQGVAIVRDFDTGKDKNEEKPLKWTLSPQTSVRIHRKAVNVEEPMAVTTMTFDASGALKNRCAFFETRPELTTGELGKAALKEKTEAAQKEAEAAETVGVESEPSNSSADASEGESSSNSSEEE